MNPSTSATPPAPEPDRLAQLEREIAELRIRMDERDAQLPPSVRDVVRLLFATSIETVANLSATQKILFHIAKRIDGTAPAKEFQRRTREVREKLILTLGDTQPRAAEVLAELLARKERK